MNTSKGFLDAYCSTAVAYSSLVNNIDIVLADLKEPLVFNKDIEEFLSSVIVPESVAGKPDCNAGRFVAVLRDMYEQISLCSALSPMEIFSSSLPEAEPVRQILSAGREIIFPIIHNYLRAKCPNASPKQRESLAEFVAPVIAKYVSGDVKYMLKLVENEASSPEAGIVQVTSSMWAYATIKSYLYWMKCAEDYIDPFRSSRDKVVPEGTARAGFYAYAQSIISQCGEMKSYRKAVSFMSAYAGIGFLAASVAEVLHMYLEDLKRAIENDNPSDEPISPVFLAILSEVFYTPVLDRLSATVCSKKPETLGAKTNILFSKRPSSLALLVAACGVDIALGPLSAEIAKDFKDRLALSVVLLGFQPSIIYKAPITFADDSANHFLLLTSGRVNYAA